MLVFTGVALLAFAASFSLSLPDSLCSKSWVSFDNKFVLESSNSLKDNKLLSDIKFESSAFVTLSNSVALHAPNIKKNSKATETSNVAFLIEIFTPSLFSAENFFEYVKIFFNYYIMSG